MRPWQASTSNGFENPVERFVSPVSTRRQRVSLSSEIISALPSIVRSKTKRACSGGGGKTRSGWVSSTACGAEVPGEAHDAMKTVLQIKVASVQARSRARVSVGIVFCGMVIL
jgi:hypothetical protein